MQGEASTSTTSLGRPTGKGLKFWSTKWLWPWSRKECRTTTSMPWLASKPSVFSHLGTEGTEPGHHGGEHYGGATWSQWHSCSHASNLIPAPAPELKPPDGFVSWALTGSHYPCPSKSACLFPTPAVPSLHIPKPCLSPCVHPSISAFRPEPGVPPQPASTLHPLSEQGRPDLCTALSAHIPWERSSTLTACHSPDSPDMSLSFPAKLR